MEWQPSWLSTFEMLQCAAIRSKLVHMADTTKITLTIKNDVLEQLDAYADEHRWSRSTAAAALIEKALATEGGK